MTRRQTVGESLWGGCLLSSVGPGLIDGLRGAGALTRVGTAGCRVLLKVLAPLGAHQRRGLKALRALGPLNQQDLNQQDLNHRFVPATAPRDLTLDQVLVLG